MAAVVLLGVLAVGSMAASYDAAESLSVGGGGDAGGSGSGSGGAMSTGDQAGTTATVPLPGWVVEHFVLVFFGGGTLLLVLGAVVVTWLRGVDGLKKVLSMLAEAVSGGALYLAVLVFLVWLIFGFTGEGIELMGGAPSESAGGQTGGSGGDQAAGTDERSVPYWYALVGIWALIVVGWSYLMHRDGSDDESSPTANDGEDLPEATVESGAGVGRQEAVSDVPPSNPVYRAWREMAAEVERTTDGTVTANEVAAAAAERGFDRDAVRTLTRLFEEVRYGDRPVTEDRERRAKSALESIEGSGRNGA